MLTKILNPGSAPAYVAHRGEQPVSVYVKIKYRVDGRLSITGVHGPTSDGNAWGLCGQITDTLREIAEYGEGWDAASVSRLAEIWDCWHLNDMRAYCEHQRTAWNIGEELEVVTYKLTTEAWKMRRAAEDKAITAAAAGELANLTAVERALIAFDLLPLYTPPDADSPLSGMMEVDRRETRTAGWVRQKEHPRGLLAKPCEVCGHKYGSGRLKEEVPADVLDWLRSLPDTTRKPAWV